MRHFCTYFDRHYLTRGLALYRSLERVADDFVLHILCLDSITYQFIGRMGLAQVHLMTLGELEGSDPELLAVKGTRSRVEYYFTCTPALIRYVMELVHDGELVSYVDADLFFFSSPSPIATELGDRSILLIEHRFPNHLRDRLQWGIYNVGMVVFRRDQAGQACVEWWRSQCLEWCFDRLEDGKFADQKYLDDWPTRFEGVHVLQHPGAGVAPWNVRCYPPGLRGKRVVVRGQPLIFFHFHRLRIVSRTLFDPHLEEYGESLTGVLASNVYVPYARALQVEMRAAGRLTAGTTAVTYRDVADMLLLRRVLLLLGPLWCTPTLGTIFRPIRRRLRLPAVARNTARGPNA